MLRESGAGLKQAQSCSLDSERTLFLEYEVVLDVLYVARSKARVIREERWLAPALG